MVRNNIVLCLVVGLFVAAQAAGQQIRFVSQQETESGNSQAVADDSIDSILDLKKFSDLQVNINGNRAKRPDDRFADKNLGALQPLDHQPSVFAWEAPNIAHNPLYFEDIALERYGQDASWLQPALSGAHFFGRIHSLPLHALIKRPFSCDYPLGHFRPGNENPYLHYSFPW